MSQLMPSQQRQRAENLRPRASGEAGEEHGEEHAAAEAGEEGEEGAGSEEEVEFSSAMALEVLSRQESEETARP